MDEVLIFGIISEGTTATAVGKLITDILWQVRGVEVRVKEHPERHSDHTWSITLLGERKQLIAAGTEAGNRVAWYMDGPAQWHGGEEVTVHRAVDNAFRKARGDSAS